MSPSLDFLFCKHDLCNEAPKGRDLLLTMPAAPTQEEGRRTRHLSCSKQVGHFCCSLALLLCCLPLFSNALFTGLWEELRHLIAPHPLKTLQLSCSASFAHFHRQQGFVLPSQRPPRCALPALIASRFFFAQSMASWAHSARLHQ